MSFNIVEAIQQHVTPDEVQSLATAIGAPADKTRSAMSTGVLGIVGSLVQQGSSPTGAANILQALTSPTIGGVSSLWKSFLGGSADKVSDVVERTSGIDSSSAHKVLATLLPIAGTVLGRKVTEGGLGPEGLMNLLASQKDILAAIPGAGAITAALGGPGLASMVPKISSKKEPATAVASSHAKRRWLPIAVAVGGLAVAALAVGSHMRNRSVSQTTTTAAEMPNNEVVVERLFETRSNEGPAKVTLSDVTFDFATANIHEGKDTIEKVAVLMKEHPTAVLRIEGHTDSVGDDATNEALSSKRAEAVKKIIVDRGVDANRIEAVGLGERQPVAPNDTEEGRAKNRRIDAELIKR